MKKVRQLEWHRDSSANLVAETTMGAPYKIMIPYRGSNSPVVVLYGGVRVGNFPNAALNDIGDDYLSEPKVAAQADYERRICSALIQPTPAETEAKPVAWQWSDFSGKWYTVDTARLTLDEQEELARSAAVAHSGRMRPLYASPSPAGGEAVTDEMVERAAPIVAFRTPEAWAKENDQFKSYYLKQARDFLTAALSSQAQTTGGESEFVLHPLHLDLLRRGVANKWIWLHDDAGMHTAEVVALGELARSGLVENDPGPFPPGPPSMPPKRITDAGRSALLESSK